MASLTPWRGRPRQRRRLRAARAGGAGRRHLRLLRRWRRRRAHTAPQRRRVRPVAASTPGARGRRLRQHDGERARPGGLDAGARRARGPPANGSSRRELAVARAAAAAGTIMCVPTFAMATPAEIAVKPDAPRWFQLYWHPDREVTKSILDQAREAGCCRSSSPSTCRSSDGASATSDRLHARSGLPHGRLRLGVR